MVTSGEIIAVVLSDSARRQLAGLGQRYEGGPCAQIAEEVERMRSGGVRVQFYEMRVQHVRNFEEFVTRFFS